MASIKDYTKGSKSKLRIIIECPVCHKNGKWGFDTKTQEDYYIHKSFQDLKTPPTACRVRVV